MSLIKRAAPRSFRRVPGQSLPRQSRRFAHDEHAHRHAQEQPESFGKGFYFTVALIPAAFLLYTVTPRTGSDSKNPITSLISSWREIKEEVAARNALHTKLVEQAGFDKALFVNSGGANRPLRYPEVFGHGSPYNVPAGHQADLSELISHYEKQAQADEQKQTEKLEKMRADAQKEQATSATGKKR